MFDTTRPLVLLLEDEMLIALDVEMTLEEAGFSVVTFTKCTSAEMWLQQHSPRIAVVDVSLSDGPCAKAVSILIERNIPFLVHTGRNHHADGVDPVFNAGTWLNKPASPEDIATAVAKLSGMAARSFEEA